MPPSEQWTFSCALFAAASLMLVRARELLERNTDQTTLTHLLAQFVLVHVGDMLASASRPPPAYAACLQDDL